MTCAKFVSKISADSLVVGLVNQSTNGTAVCLYDLVQEQIQLKPRFQTTNPEKLISHVRNYVLSGTWTMNM